MFIRICLLAVTYLMFKLTIFNLVIEINNNQQSEY